MRSFTRTLAVAASVLLSAPVFANVSCNAVLEAKSLFISTPQSAPEGHSSRHAYGEFVIEKSSEDKKSGTTFREGSFGDDIFLVKVNPRQNIVTIQAFFKGKEIMSAFTCADKAGVGPHPHVSIGGTTNGKSKSDVKNFTIVFLTLSASDQDKLDKQLK
jgi:hypothetical protein